MNTEITEAQRMKPRWARARALAEELKSLGMEIISHHADLWKIAVQVRQGIATLDIEERTVPSLMLSNDD